MKMVHKLSEISTRWAAQLIYEYKSGEFTWKVSKDSSGLPYDEIYLIQLSHFIALHR